MQAFLSKKNNPPVPQFEKCITRNKAGECPAETLPDFPKNTDLASTPDLNSRIQNVDYDFPELRTPQISDTYIIVDSLRKSKDSERIFSVFLWKFFISSCST